MELSLSPLFPRSYHSIYQAIQESFNTASQLEFRLNGEDAYGLLYRGSTTARYLRGLEESNCSARKYYVDKNIQFFFNYLEEVNYHLLNWCG